MASKYTTKHIKAELIKNNETGEIKVFLQPSKKARLELDLTTGKQLMSVFVE